MRRHFLGCLLVAAVVLVGVAARPAMAQEVRRLVVGGTFDIPVHGLGATGAVEFPLRTMGAGTLSGVVLGTVFSGGNLKLGAGGGLAWTIKVNNKTRVFAAVFAGLLRHLNDVGDNVVDFGATPGGGIRYSMKSNREFYVMISGALLNKDTGTAVGSQVMLGITMPLGR